MSENPNVERAAKVLTQRRKSTNNPVISDNEAAEVIDSAGLLVTPLHERALEACERISSRAASHVHPDCTDQPEAVRVGRESLALKEKAKGAAATCSYAIAPTGDADQHWSVLNEHGEAVYMGPKSQARRVAAALNEGDES